MAYKQSDINSDLRSTSSMYPIHERLGPNTWYPSMCGSGPPNALHVVSASGHSASKSNLSVLLII